MAQMFTTPTYHRLQHLLLSDPFDVILKTINFLDQEKVGKENIPKILHIVQIQRLGYEKKIQPKSEVAMQTPMRRA